MRGVVANMWLFGSIMRDHLSGDRVTSPLVRTTTAATVLRSGEKPNVVPRTAVAIVNHRVHPSDTMEDVLAHDRKVINDPRVQVRPLHGNPPTLTSSTSTAAYAAIRDAVKVRAWPTRDAA